MKPNASPGPQRSYPYLERKGVTSLMLKRDLPLFGRKLCDVIDAIKGIILLIKKKLFCDGADLLRYCINVLYNRFGIERRWQCIVLPLKHLLFANALVRLNCSKNINDRKLCT